MRAFTSDNDLAKIYFESRQPKKKVIKEGYAEKNSRLYRLYLAYLKAQNLTEQDLSFTTYKDMVQTQSYFHGRTKPIKESSYCPYWKIYRLTCDAEPEATLIPGTEEQGFTEQSAMVEIAKRNKEPDQDGTSWWSCSPDPEFDHNKWNRDVLGEEVDAPKGELVHREQKREVQIGTAILDEVQNSLQDASDLPDVFKVSFRNIKKLADELIKMHLHTTKLKDKPLSNWDTLQLKNH